jgi:hypothetical protein
MERAAVSGFFSSWATSAVEGARHGGERGGHLADLVGTMGEVRQLVARADVAAHEVGGGGEAADRSRHRARQQQRAQQRGDHGEGREQPDLILLVGDDLVDLARASRHQQHALDARGALDGHGRGDDLLALLIEQQHGRRLALERLADLGVRRAVGVADLLVDGQVLVREHPGLEAGPEVLCAGATAVGDLGLVARKLAALQERRGIHDQRAVAAVDTGAARRRLDQAAQDRRHALGADRQLVGGEGVVVGRGDLFLRRRVGMDDEATGLDARVAGNGGGDDFALHAQGFPLGVDEPGVVLVEVEDAGDHHYEAGEARHQDAAQEAAGDEADRREGAPPGQRLLAHPRPAADHVAGACGERAEVTAGAGEDGLVAGGSRRRPLGLERHSPSLLTDAFRSAHACHVSRAAHEQSVRGRLCHRPPGTQRAARHTSLKR